MCAVDEIGEAVFRSDPATVATEETPFCLAKKAIVLKFGVPANDRILIAAKRLRRIAV
jgi:hypothetical protein